MINKGSVVQPGKVSVDQSVLNRACHLQQSSNTNNLNRLCNEMEYWVTSELG